MSSSAVSHALDDMLDLLDGEDVTLNEAQDVLVMNAESVLDEYHEASTQEQAQHVRSFLAQLLQMINQNFPHLVGSMEYRNAVEVVSSPHLSGSDVPQHGGTAPVEVGPVPPDLVDPPSMAGEAPERIDTMGHVENPESVDPARVHDEAPDVKSALDGTKNTVKAKVDDDKDAKKGKK